MLTQSQLILKGARLDGADRGSYLIPRRRLFMRSLSILLCGYGWFAGIPEGETNNAELIARALDGETLVCGDVRATVRGMITAMM